jgi:hypothetical protein
MALISKTSVYTLDKSWEPGDNTWTGGTRVDEARFLGILVKSCRLTTVKGSGPMGEGGKTYEEVRILGLLVKKETGATVGPLSSGVEKVTRKRGPRKVKVEDSAQPEETAPVTKPTKKVKPPVEPPAGYDGEV